MNENLCPVIVGLGPTIHTLIAPFAGDVETEMPDCRKHPQEASKHCGADPRVGPEDDAAGGAIAAPTLKSYTFARAIAHFEFRWETCASAKCRALRRCTGGGRGAFRKRGRPLCVAADEKPPA